jgi:hypothetical protein
MMSGARAMATETTMATELATVNVTIMTAMPVLTTAH